MAMLAAPKTGSSQRLAILAIAGVLVVRHIMAMITNQFAWQIFREINFENLYKMNAGCMLSNA
jgi:hypothetical protein